MAFILFFIFDSNYGEKDHEVISESSLGELVRWRDSSTDICEWCVMLPCFHELGLEATVLLNLDITQRTLRDRHGPSEIQNCMRHVVGQNLSHTLDNNLT